MSLAALRFAENAHQGQYRLGGEPYIHHCVRVAGYARLYIKHVGLYVPAAYMHDVLEDCPHISYEDINKSFGVLIADTVQDLTNQFTSEKCPNLKRRERKIREHERLAQVNNISQQIKLCDRLDNVTTKLYTLDHGLSKRYVEETISLLDHIGIANPNIAAQIKDRLNAYTVNKKNKVGCCNPNEGN